MIGKRNFEFERFIRSAVSKNSIGGVLGMVLLVGLALFFIGFGISIPFAPLIVLGLIPIGGILLILYRFKGDLKGSDYWINQLVQEPQKIVWIKPVNIRHTAAYVITLYSEMHFDIRNSDGLGTMVKCVSAEDQLLFLRGMKQYAPHAHIGFTEAIQYHYKADPQRFIPALEAGGVYNPVGAMQV